jgi:hypothetical protein
MWDSYAWRTLTAERAATLARRRAAGQVQPARGTALRSRRRLRAATGRALVRLGERLAAPAGAPVAR